MEFPGTRSRLVGQSARQSYECMAAYKPYIHSHAPVDVEFISMVLNSSHDLTNGRESAREKEDKKTDWHKGEL